MKKVHQPLEVMSLSGRNDVMNRPRVGIVQTTAMTIAAREAHGELSALRALVETGLRPGSSSLSAELGDVGVCGGHRASSLRI
ncbi:hypothetical protein ACVW2K_001343 [Nocardioides sp. HB32]